MVAFLIPHPMPNILLCTLGTTWQIVPEAYCFLPNGFNEVHILTFSRADKSGASVDNGVVKI